MNILNATDTTRCEEQRASACAAPRGAQCATPPLLVRLLALMTRSFLSLAPRLNDPT
jgi:hypothetical protein